ncbi:MULTISPECIES: serine/threonine-protein kinase [unclassified Microcoleus]|uniref:serine/threonine-protein kinase n=1 Tax=unclassified Microcoleus TaxID=2642155 RepID=UPI002FD53FD1
METLQRSEKIIAERYRIIGKLGQGGLGITYAAVDLNSNQKVALKALSLRLTTEWKKVELFEREAKTLSGLNHPGIPRYIDCFQVDTSQDCCFYIAQQLAPGKSLAQLVENGWKPNEAQVRHIASQLLEILVYLQSLLPATIHRDIKPQNIILQKNGRVFLVDFGAVQNTYHHTVTGGSTVVGTYGYMAPEQFRGKAVLSTDLYGLGTTLLFLLTQKFPSDLPRHKLKVQFREIVSISTELADWLEKVIEPAIEDRFNSAKDALSALRGEQPSGINPDKMFQRSPLSRITLIDTKWWLFIKIHPDRSPSTLKGFFQFVHLSYKVLLPFSLIMGFLLFLVFSLFEILFEYTSTDWIFTLFERFFLISILAITTFTLFYALMWLCRCLCRIVYHRFARKIQISPQHIQRVKLSGIHLPLLKISITFCLICTKSRNYCFGLFLPQAEKEWLVGELNNCLSKLK